MENNTTKKIVGGKINSLLAEQGKTQKELAEELDVLPNVISYFCKGTRTPNTEQLIKISRFFNVSTDYLLGLSGDSTTDQDLKKFLDYTGLNREIVEELHSIAKLHERNFELLRPATLFVKEHLYYISSELLELEKKSKEYFELQNELENTQNLKDKNEIFDALNKKDMECNVLRYAFSKHFEETADYFDRRKQVKNNGSHNPTNK